MDKISEEYFTLFEENSSKYLQPLEERICNHLVFFKYFHKFITLNLWDCLKNIRWTSAAFDEIDKWMFFERHVQGSSADRLFI